MRPCPTMFLGVHPRVKNSASEGQRVTGIRIPLGSRLLYAAKLEQMKLSAPGETRDEA